MKRRTTAARVWLRHAGRLQAGCDDAANAPPSAGGTDASVAQFCGMSLTEHAGPERRRSSSAGLHEPLLVRHRPRRLRLHHAAGNAESDCGDLRQRHGAGEELGSAGAGTVGRGQQGLFRDRQPPPQRDGHRRGHPVRQRGRCAQIRRGARAAGSSGSTICRGITFWRQTRETNDASHAPALHRHHRRRRRTASASHRGRMRAPATNSLLARLVGRRAGLPMPRCRSTTPTRRPPTG